MTIRRNIRRSIDYVCKPFCSRASGITRWLSSIYTVGRRITDAVLNVIGSIHAHKSWRSVRHPIVRSSSNAETEPLRFKRSLGPVRR